MKTLWIAGAVCILGFASAGAQAKVFCDIHHLGYTKAQCDDCTNMRWNVSRVFPQGVCASITQPQPTPTAKPAVPQKALCDIHHLGYTKAQCDTCTNMVWSVSKIFPQGTCVSTAPPQTINTARGPAPMPPAPACRMASFGGTLPLSAPNFSGTGWNVGVCPNGYDLARSQLRCTPTGVPARAYNYPNTHVTCNMTTGPGNLANPQISINGQVCCL
jgi:hypothetical protein